MNPDHATETPPGLLRAAATPGGVAVPAPAAGEGLEKRALSPADRAGEGTAGSGVTGRGLVVGLIGVVVTCGVVAWAELVLMTLQIGYLQMPPAVIGLLLVILLVNAALRAIARPLALTPQDLTVAYCMMLLAAMISSRGWMQKLLPLLVSANYFASDANDWRSLYFPHIRQWLVPFDVAGEPKQEVATRFFERLRAGEAIPWQAWVGPVLAWSCSALFVFGAFFCMAAILRRSGWTTKSSGSRSCSCRSRWSARTGTAGKPRCCATA
jgi:hypothetical protein